MKLGTIICNHWASDDNPTKYFIYTGMQGEYATGICFIDGKIDKLKFYANDFRKSEVFEPVGYCKAFEIMKEDLKKIKGEST
jgi:hypothetical protein